jgi:hypothetical protein
MRVIVRYPTVAASLAAFALGIGACNDDAPTRAGDSATATTPARSESLGAAWKRTRARVIEGARRDFDSAVGGPHGFASCFISRFRRTLTQDRVAELAAIHATGGEPAAARALNALGVPDGDACGGRRRVPQLTEAATGLRPERPGGAPGGVPRKVGRPADPSVALPSRARLARLGLTLGPPANLVDACKRVARQTPLTVYCPPIVPRGPVEAPRRRRGNAYLYGDEQGYGLSLQSASLLDPERARAYDPDGPPITFPNRPREADFVWDPFAAKHWAVAATAPARVMRNAVDLSAAYPRAQFKSRPLHFTVKGVEATLLTGDIAGGGFAGSGHAMAYWQIDNTLYQASVHFDDKAPVAEAIARGLMVQMVDCVPGSTTHRPRVCEWVFPGQG